MYIFFAHWTFNHYFNAVLLQFDVSALMKADTLGSKQDWLQVVGGKNMSISPLDNYHHH